MIYAYIVITIVYILSMNYITKEYKKIIKTLRERLKEEVITVTYYGKVIDDIDKNNKGIVNKSFRNVDNAK